MARHIERAENTARLLDVTYRTSLLPYQVRRVRHWRGPSRGRCRSSRPGSPRLTTSAIPSVTAENVLRYMILDSTQSVVDLLLPARGRANRPASVRGAITSEMYEDLNSALDRDARLRLRADRGRRRLRLSRLGQDALAPLPRRDVRHDAARRGRTTSSGSARTIERADNTARILDTKYHILLPSVDGRRRRRRLTTSGSRC